MPFEIVDMLTVAVLFVCWVIQMVYYWACLAKPCYYRQATDKGKKTIQPASPPVSLIIYTRNEANNLGKQLPAILEQNYPCYEVIVVDNCSSDDTEDIIKRLSSKYKHLYRTYVPQESKNVSRKKLALTLGIKAAHYDSLLFMEGDSYPVSPDWLRLMARHFRGEKTIVLGFSALDKKGGRYSQYDYFFSELQMMSLALMKHPYMGNGKNLGYSKSEFARQQTFSEFSMLEAGDDDLLINELARPDNVSVELSPDSVMRVNMNEPWRWKEWKIKRMITLPFYRKFPVVFWGIEKTSRVSFYFLLLFVCMRFFFNGQVLGGAAVLFSTRFLTQWFAINKTAAALQLPKFYFNLLIFDFVQPFVNGYFYLCGIFQGKLNGYGKYGRR